MDEMPTDYPVYRSLREAFGPGAQLDVEQKPSVSDWLCVAAMGVAIGFLWYLAVGLRAGA